MRGKEGGSQTVLVTGAGRGIGLEWVRQYTQAGWHVLACCRSPSRAQGLRELEVATPDRVRVHALDVVDPDSREALAKALGARPVDVLIHNAGIYGPDGVALGRATDEQAWIEVVRVNTIAPLKLTELLVENVAASRRKLIAVMSSGMGSIADNTRGGAYLYRSSKAALNAVARSLAVDLRPRGIAVVALCPGWVRTAMGGPGAPLDVATSVLGMRRILDGMTLEESGSFFRYEGTRVPW